MQIKNLGNSINAMDDLQFALSNISNIKKLSANELESLTTTTAKYSNELLKSVISQMSLTV